MEETRLATLATCVSEPVVLWWLLSNVVGRTCMLKQQETFCLICSGSSHAIRLLIFHVSSWSAPFQFICMFNLFLPENEEAKEHQLGAECSVAMQGFTFKPSLFQILNLKILKSRHSKFSSEELSARITQDTNQMIQKSWLGLSSTQSKNGIKWFLPFLLLINSNREQNNGIKQNGKSFVISFEAKVNLFRLYVSQTEIKWENAFNEFIIHLSYGKVFAFLFFLTSSSRFYYGATSLPVCILNEKSCGTSSIVRLS